MQGLILAAGMGKRLKGLTKDNTKCMVQVNGVSLIDRMLHQLDRLGLSRIVIVIGYEGKKLVEYIQALDISTYICYVENPIYDKTNNIYSLALAKNYLIEEDTLLLESDLIFEDSVLETLLEDKRETLALVDKYENWMDGTVIRIDDNDNILDFIPGKKFVFEDIPDYYKTVNIYKFSKHFSEFHYVPFLDAYSKALGNNEYYEQVLRVITMLDEPEIKAKRLEGQLWYEIDDIQDLDIAASMFAPDDDRKVELIRQRYGGYWRYPKMLDFCYLVNPFFPPQRLMDEVKANFEVLFTQYPSGMKVNSLLASKNFGVCQENIIVGNGAAELIKSLMSRLHGKTGMIRPTFEEYPNRYKEEEGVIFIPENDDFSYKASDLTAFFDGREIENLILINPDNPSGNYIPKADLLILAAWTKERGINLVVDESFVDFSDECSRATLIEQEILDQNPHLYVVKSISKSYGVPGLRLGVLASGNRAAISWMKKDVAIWNINSFAEFYTQIEEKYKKDYILSLNRLREERRSLEQMLGSLPGIRVIPSQANYIMVEITNGMASGELTKRLLIGHHIFVKDLSDKVKKEGRQFLRIAVRDAADNHKLIEALQKELQ
ncbi:MAG: aminotransferase class I/II-fold pyridoxal phosphate-dependent enzyme [Ruminococcus sp.]|jgi:histidinol-phosphate/aromatic aminotransferase/cobyric acid decarboxylase-like protein/choline kinase|nr:aminotransferase class I/II-fold pyridoxal phosphate-dependent enzyme [Ruminococcus sp.]